MADLIAQGKLPEHRWRRPLPVGEPIVLGRSAGLWAVPWDKHISRRHAELVWDGRRLQVKKFPEAKNPIFFHGRQAAECRVLPEEHFVIGQTSFLLVDQPWSWAGEGGSPIYEHQYSYPDLASVQFRNPDSRLEVLSRLPEVLAESVSDEDMCVRLVSMLLAGLPHAEAAAVAVLKASAAPQDFSGHGKGLAGSEKFSGTHELCQLERPSEQGLQGAGPFSETAGWIQGLYWDQRVASSGPFRPSQRLILESAQRGQTVVHLWGPVGGGTERSYTNLGQYDWAFCTPILPEGLPPWVIYLAGRFPTPGFPAEPSPPAELREDMKWTELVASMVGSLRRMRRLERHQAVLSQFFSPLVLKNLGSEEPDRFLSPQESEVSVLFCDLRGFSRHSEEQAENLRELLDRVSQALGVMTRHILDQGGVVGDYQGDAALGFWGWPVRWKDMIERTCRAALAIRAEFFTAAQDPQSPLAGFQMGIGIAAGRAVAGRIGPPEQAKVTVFGPVVNLAARLESMTKIFHTPILLDPAMVEAVRQKVPRSVARVRRVAVVRPYGMEMPLEVAELLPPADQYPQLSDEQIALYEAGLDAFLAGRWSQAYQYLHQLPADDQVADFLTAFITQHNRMPPPQWNGVISLQTK